MEIAVIGAGAAGCFCAIELKRRHPDASITIYEKGKHPMAKLAITGGGRCNITNSFRDAVSLTKIYPRGERLIKRALKVFGNREAMQWFENEGVSLTVQDDGCVFPKSQDAMQVVRTLEKLMKDLHISTRCNHRLNRVSALEQGGYSLEFGNEAEICADKVIVATGSPDKKLCGIFSAMGIATLEPVPSLFTFSLPGDPITGLMGTVVENAATAICSTSFRATGPLLITDWGMSGPAILKLSSYAARYLAETGYNARLSINWAGNKSGEAVLKEIIRLEALSPKKLVASTGPEYIPSRLWQHLVCASGARRDIRWAEIGTKGKNRLVEQIINDEHRINGKSRHRDEFVTCGGISLSEVSMNTLESKRYPGLYFIGEMLDVDAITGGFNLQAAWSTAHIAASSL